MHTITIDDESLAVRAMLRVLRKKDPDGTHIGTVKTGVFLEYVRSHPELDIAFIDVEMKTDGITLTKKIKQIAKDLNIVIYSGHPQYKADALDQHVSSFITKPVTDEKLQTALDNLRFPLKTGNAAAEADDIPKLLKVTTFGNFVVYGENGDVMKFSTRHAQAILVNLFVPIVFTFREDKEYVPLPARYIGLFLQMILFLVTSVYAMIKAVQSEGMSRSHYRTISISGIIMSFFIVIQMFYPLMPFYSMGCLFGTCLIHTFIYKDKEAEHNIAIKLAKQKAYKDGLTGVKNRLAYLEALTELETAFENGELTEYGVVVFDVNGLKTVNDTLGHEAGDAYIQSGCSLICRQFTHSPVFRVGGDEFVAILRGDDYANREALVASFRQTVSENLQNGSVIIASGLAVYDAATDSSYNDVFRRADASMYEQKRTLKAAAHR